MNATAMAAHRELALLLRLDARLLLRHGVVAAVAVVTAVWAGLLKAVPTELATALLAPALYLDAAIVGLMFVGGAVLIERRQGSLEALAVSPLRPSTYVASKVIALTVLAVAASGTIVAVVGTGTRPVELLLGVVLLSVPILMTAMGVAAGATTITGYLFALQPATVPAVLPLAMIAGWIPVWLAWLGPTTGPYRLLQAGTGGAPLTGAELGLAIVIPVLTSLALWRWTITRVRVRLMRSGRLT